MNNEICTSLCSEPLVVPVVTGYQGFFVEPNIQPKRLQEAGDLVGSLLIFFGVSDEYLHMYPL